jgi:predicted methyltransferase
MKRRVVLAVMCCVLPLACARLAAQAPPPAPTAATLPYPAPFAATARHAFDNVEQWSKVFDDPKRDAWQKPAEVVAALGLRPGMCVADLGAGTGYFMPYLSAAVGATGSVLAVEPEPNLVAHLRQRAEQTQATNVVPILASFDNPRLPAAAVDLVLIADTFHHLDARLGYLRGLQRALKPGGRVAVIDWRKEPLPEGPPPDHKLPRQQVVDEMAAAGYALVEERDFLPYQYFLVFAVHAVP